MNPGPNRTSMRRIAALAGSLVLGAASWAQACPSCANALDGSDVGPGFNASILFMLITPVAVVITGAGAIYLTHRGEGRHGPASEENEP